jgi:hypothetical protein
MRTLRTHLIALVAVPAIALALPDGSSAESARATVRIDVGIVKAIRHYRVTTRRLQSVMGHRVVRLTPLRHASLRRVHTVWRKRAVAVKRRFAAGPRHRRGWMCIHRYEGAWSEDGSPYYGGLQMDIGFQQHYGGMLLRAKGTADNWTPLEQMWVAERAYRSGRGFYPWPNTARYCGLI